MPISLNEAIKIARKSEFISELLGDKFASSYFEAKEEECGEYRRTINQWEIEKYLIAY